VVPSFEKATYRFPSLLGYAKYKYPLKGSIDKLTP